MSSASAFAVPARSRAPLGKYVYPVQKISTSGASNIKIVGVRGHLKLRGTRHAKFLSLKVQHSQGRRFEDWHLSVERRGITIFLEVFNVAYGRQLKNQVSQDLWPEFDIELEGVSLPTTVAWREGSLDFENWEADLEASFLKGVARVSGGTGKIAFEPVDADVTIRAHSGPIHIKGHEGRVNLAHDSGDISLNWLAGKITLDECRGILHVETAESDVTVRGGKGELRMQIGRGGANISGFSGPVHGTGDAAKWELAASAPADVNITTQTGPVGVNWITGGAKVFLTSTRGSIQFPQKGFLKSGDREGRRVVEGIKTSKTMGQVFIRTGSGPIRWR